MIDIVAPDAQHKTIMADCITFSPPCTNDSISSLISLLLYFFLDIVFGCVYLMAVTS